MKLPQHFDQNEWFILFWLVLTFLIVLLLPKRFPLSITILMMLFSSTVARLSDHLLSATADLYDVMDAPTYELFDLFTYALYAPFGYLLVYFFEKLTIRGLWIAVYIVIGSIGGTLFEWLALYFHVFTYKGWHLSFSFGVYLLSQIITLLFFNYIKSVQQLSTK